MRAMPSPNSNTSWISGGIPVPSVRFLVRPDLYFFSSEELDYALVALSETSMDGAAPLDRFSYHRLAPSPGKILDGEWITIIQHPSGQRRQFAIRENQLLGRTDQFLWYMSDTAPGSSGAPAFNDSFQVVALHHSGKARKEGGLYVLRDGRKVESLDGIEDSDVIWEKNEGVRVSVMCADIQQRLNAADPYVQELRAAIASETGHVMARKIASPPDEALPAAGHAPAAVAQGGVTVPLTLQLSIGYGEVKAAPPALAAAPAASALSTAAAPGEFEKLVPPPVDNQYENRTGYDPDFLSTPVPLPEIVDLSDVSKLDDGSAIIPYEHFSLAIHKTRRLALFTASNVDGRTAMRRPEPGLYTRKALFGLQKDSDKESWLTDPRIPRQHQLPEVFYNNDGGAFDKGHIVRREDLCWGETRDRIVKANADSYHVTNCSPQVAGYNQASKKGLWGKLEDVVLDQVEKEQKFSLLAGPVLAPDDKFFEGRDFTGNVRIQIPRRFWKIVVAEKEGLLQAFAFVLEQDLTAVPLENEEFQVTEDWTPFLVSIRDLEAELGGIRFPQVLKDADGSLTQSGDELLKTRKARRRPRSKPATAGRGGV